MKKLSILKYIPLLLFTIFAGCTTYSVTVVHSEGVASDVVDENQTQTPTSSVQATATIPASISK